MSVVGDQLAIELGDGGGKQQVFPTSDNVFVFPRTGGTVTCVRAPHKNNAVLHFLLTSSKATSVLSGSNPGAEVAQRRGAMKQTFTSSKSWRVCSGVLFAAVLVLAPRTTFAVPFTLECQPAHEAAPPEWFGGQWEQPISVRVDLQSRMVEIYDEKGVLIAGSLRSSRLSGLGGYEFDIVADENVIRWGVVRMWGISGYVDRKSGRIDVLWTNDRGHDETSLTRQFHGTCRER